MIVKRKGKWCLLTKDGSRTLGCHPTREEAVNQEAAVMASKARSFTGKDGRKSAALRGYDYKWKKVRDAFLAAHPKCNYPDCKSKATEAEHISGKPARLGGSDKWKDLQPRCKSHHSKKTASIDGGFGNPKKDREIKTEATEVDMSESYSDDERPASAFLKKMFDILKGKVSDEDLKKAIKTARSHAGGKAPRKKKELEDAEKLAAGELEEHGEEDPEENPEENPEEDLEEFWDEGVSGYPSPKLEKTDARVKYKASGPNRCGDCRFMLVPQGCRLVEGTIDSAYYCKIWTARPAMFDEDADLDAIVEAVSDELEAEMFKGKIPPAFLKHMKKKKGDDDGDEDGKKKMPPFLAKKLGRKASELYDFFEFRGEPEHRSDWRLFLELGTDPEWIPYLPKPGNYKHPKYGEIAVTKDRNERFVRNFDDKIYQETLPIDAEHSPKVSGAMGWVVGMRTNENGSADAKVKWTDRGRDMLEKDRFRYFSPEWFNVWPDPSTGKKHFDVAIGGALTTRPFFKEGALRSLVSCEGGMYSPRGAFYKEETMSEDTKKKADDKKLEASEGDGDGKGHVDPQTFEELVESNRQLAEQVETQATELKQQATDLKQATEKTDKLETAALHKHITDIVMGKDEKVGGPRWFGEQDKNISLLEKMADKFDGLESEECQEYISQQKTHAEQLAASNLFTIVGSDSKGDGGKQDAQGEFMSLSEKRLEEMKKTDENAVIGDAMSQIAAEKPELYDKYNEESTVKI